MTSKLSVVTLPDSGAQLTVRGVSQAMVTLEVRQGYPPPQPPKKQIPVGKSGDEFIEEIDPEDPKYLAALEEYALTVGLKVANLMIMRSLVKNLTDEDKAAVAEVRADYEEQGVALPKNDKLVWFRHVAIESDEDWMYYVSQVSGEPAEEAVAAVQDGFPGDIPGDEHLEQADAS